MTTTTDIELDVPELDFDAWDTMHTRLFDRHLGMLADIDDDAVLSMTTNTPRTDRGLLLRGDDGKLALDWNGFVGTAPVRDAERQWKLIERAARKGAACYFGIAPRKGGTRGQGGKGDLLSHTLLAADIDWSEGDHQSSSNPPREVLEEWIKDLPVTPGLIVNSGGGYHLYVTLDEPVDVQRDPRGVALYAGWRQWWIDRAAQDGFSIDIAPLTNQALVLRVAGTPAPKYQGTLVTIEDTLTTTDEDYAIDDLATLFPAPPEPERRKRAAKPGAERSPRDEKFAVPAGGSLDDFTPGDLFAVECDLESIVFDLFEARFASASGNAGALRLPWTNQGTVDPEYPEGKNSGIFIHYDGTPLLSIYGQGVREDWASFAGTVPDVTSEIDLYNGFYCVAQYIARLGADANTSWTLAARLVVHYRTLDDDRFADYDSMIADLAAAESVENVTALIPERPRTQKVRKVTEEPVHDKRAAKPPTRWDAEHYERAGAGSHALPALNGVAPLVVAARGYETVTADDATAFATDALGLNTGRTKTFTTNLGEYGLALPWFAMDSDDLVPRWEVTGQKTFDSGTGSMLDSHPSVPEDWSDAPILVEYSLVQADLALTKLLLTEGISHDDLADASDAHRRLRAMLDRIPEERRVLILALGLGAWLDAPQWQTLDLKGRTVWLANDGVEYDDGWQRIRRLFSLLQRKRARPALVDLMGYRDLDDSLDASTSKFPQRPGLHWTPERHKVSRRSLK